MSKFKATIDSGKIFLLSCRSVRVRGATHACVTCVRWQNSFGYLMRNVSSSVEAGLVQVIGSSLRDFACGCYVGATETLVSEEARCAQRPVEAVGSVRTRTLCKLCSCLCGHATRRRPSPRPWRLGIPKYSACWDPLVQGRNTGRSGDERVRWYHRRQALV